LEELRISDGRPSPEEQLIYKENYVKVMTALLKLSDTYRDVFILHAIGDVKLKDIADMYGKTESWARVTYFRAKQQIVQEVSE